jgi:hypothetical protein
LALTAACFTAAVLAGCDLTGGLAGELVCALAGSTAQDVHVKANTHITIILRIVISS